MKVGSVEHDHLEICIEPVNCLNINILKHIDLILFPVNYNSLFYIQLLSDIKSVGFFFVFRDCIVGICTFKISNCKCYIMTFGILPEYRYQGIGCKCIKKVEEYVYNIYSVEIINLHVHIENIEGILFYKKNQYKIVSLVPDYYNKIEPRSAYLLVKWFMKESKYLEEF